jgi:transposase
MGRPVKRLELTLEERIELRNRVRAATTPQRDSLRARIILLRAQGEKVEDVAGKLGVSVACVSKCQAALRRKACPVDMTRRDS